MGAARAIMTTDTFPKAATRTARIGDATVTVAGIAKGSGMIAPDMATMLCFLATDAKVPAGALQAILKKGTDRSFNCVTVDSDTSTSDTVLLFATGAAKHPRVPAEGGADAARLRARGERGADGPRPDGRPRRRGRAEADPHRRRPARPPREARTASPCRSPTRRW